MQGHARAPALAVAAVLLLGSLSGSFANRPIPTERRRLQAAGACTSELGAGDRRVAIAQTYKRRESPDIQ